MAITIIDQPYSVTPRGQDLIILATSTNIDEDGFLYKVTLLIGASTTVSYIKPNPEGALVFNFESLVQLSNIVDYNGPIHSFSAFDWAIETSGFGVVPASLELLEAWIVDGVLTDDPDSEDAVGFNPDISGIWNATYQASDGYKPDPLTRYALNGTTQNWLTDRRWNTHRNDAFMSQATTRVLIPVREADYGLLSMIWVDGYTLPLSVRVTIFDTNGAPHGFDIDITDGDTFMHFPLYPANLNASENVDWLKPSDFPNWRYIQIRAEATSGGAVVSVNYLLYNVARYGPLDCNHDVIRIGWVNSAGGWDYFNFTKKSEIRRTYDRKSYTKILGNYGTASGDEPFNFTRQDSGLTALKPIIGQYLTVNSDWISEQEFVYLGFLMASQQVHWLHDDGTFTPILVEATDYTEARERNGKLKNFSTVFRLANNQWV